MSTPADVSFCLVPPLPTSSVRSTPCSLTRTPSQNACTPRREHTASRNRSRAPPLGTQPSTCATPPSNRTVTRSASAWSRPSCSISPQTTSSSQRSRSARCSGFDVATNQPLLPTPPAVQPGVPARSRTATFATVPDLPRVPAVSVVVPAHLADAGQAAFLSAAMDSLVAQTLPDWEAVVVDDGSPLPVEPLLPSDPRIRLLRHGRNRGLGAALNSGLEAATAGNVAYLPVDDLIVPEHLASLAAALDGDDEAAL